MDLSEGWKSTWSITSVFRPPLLYSSATAKPLGPLKFHPTSDTNLLLKSNLLHSEIHLSSEPSKIPISLASFFTSSMHDFVPNDIIRSMASDAIFASHCKDPNFHNALQVLHRRRNGDLILFFLVGPNSEGIGCGIIPLNQKVLIKEDGEIAYKWRHAFHQRIHKFFVTSIFDSEFSSSLLNSLSHDSHIEGYLLACTLYSVHWFAIQSKNAMDIPVLVPLGYSKFSITIRHACWSPYLQGESLVLLDNGELHLFDLRCCLRALKLPEKLRGCKVLTLPSKIGNEAVDNLISEKECWLSCGFSWHPRIIIVACSTAVFSVDFRFQKFKVATLAKIEMCDSFGVHYLQNDCFIAFCKASFNDFFFSVVTKHHLLLFDTRQPLSPILQWDHHLGYPCSIHMMRLSELRPSIDDGEFKWASDSGFAILLGSFWDCQFSVFCYGPSIQVTEKSLGSKMSKSCNVFYAWELPSGLCLLDSKCCCGNCLFREDFSKASLRFEFNRLSDEEIVLGFCVVSEDLSSLNHMHDFENASKTNGLGGFTLIRLTSSGKLEAQRYKAAWDFTNGNCNNEVTPSFQHSIQFDQEQKIPCPYSFIKFDYLFGYLSGNLTKIFTEKMQSCLSHSKTKCNVLETEYVTQDSKKLLYNMMKVIGLHPTGSSPTILSLLDGINFPISIYEIALERIWAGLSLDLLQLAFPSCVDLRGPRKLKVNVECLDIPDLSNVQLPPFLLRKPSQRKTIWQRKVPYNNGLVGPVLPIHALLALREVDRNESSSKMTKDINEEFTYECKGVKSVVQDYCYRESSSVSLSDDHDTWVASQEMQENHFIIFEPQAFSLQVQTSQAMPECGLEENEFTSLISRKQKGVFANEYAGLEIFDDLSPIVLKFDSPTVNFEEEELKVYSCLKRQFSKWQESFKPYNDFCSSKLPRES